MQIVGCKFDSNGLITQNQTLLNFTSNVYVFGPSAAMNISNTPFTNVVNGALYSVEGGQLNLENCAIQGGVSGLQVASKMSLPPQVCSVLSSAVNQVPRCMSVAGAESLLKSVVCCRADRVSTGYWSVLAAK
jgi:hypothetical protein